MYLSLYIYIYIYIMFFLLFFLTPGEGSAFYCKPFGGPPTQPWTQDPCPDTLVTLEPTSLTLIPLIPAPAITTNIWNYIYIYIYSEGDCEISHFIN